jgi:hypothetical protein
MRAARRSSSKKLAAVLLVLAAAGCAGGANRLLEGRERSELRLAMVDPLAVAPAPVAAVEPVQIMPAAAAPDVTIEPVAAPVEVLRETSAWCRYLKEDSAAQANILRSPSLGGSLNDEGNASVTLGLSMASFAKAHLVEEAAEAKCRRYLAESGLQKLVFVSPHELTGAGFRAKFEAVSARLSEVQGLRADIAAHLASGAIDAETAAGLGVAINQFVASGSEARWSAGRGAAQPRVARRRKPAL